MEKVTINYLRAQLNSTIGKNIISLYVLQISYYVLPLIAIPYLVRVLGAEKFGLVAFGQSLISFFVLLVSYGFELTATREISVNQKDNLAVSIISCSVWIAKFILCLIGFLILLLLILIVPKMRQIPLLLIILYGIVVGNMLFPNWLFLGLERMKAISVINLTMRILATAGIFVLIKTPDDFLVYAGLLSFQWVLAGVSGVVFAISRLKIRIILPGRSQVLDVLSRSTMLFVSNVAQSAYMVGNSFILGLLTNYTAVGYYSAAEKITLSCLGIFRPLANALYPRLSRLASSSKGVVLLWGKRLLYVMGGLGLLASLALFFGAPMIVKIVLGKGFSQSVLVLQILSALPFLVAISDVLGTQIMLPFGKDGLYTLIRVLTAVLHITIAFLVVPVFNQSGMAFVFVLSQAFILISTFICLSYWKLSPFNYKVYEKVSHHTVKSS